MVQRKGPDILTTKTKSKKSRAKAEKHVSPHQNQDTENKGASDLKKKMKKARSIKRISELDNLGAHLGHQYVQHKKKRPPLIGASEGSSPNYMKPTTSSDARKERLQVSFHTPTTGDKTRSTRNPNTSNHSRVSSSTTSSSPFRNNKSANNKPAKALTRKSSLKLVRPLMKKILGTPLFPKINTSGSTCSSTIKDSKFPKELELSPGATESEGTSASKVCPYTYCSLNGHRHEPLPPLKSFMSSRRRLLKTQKSMKLKGIPSFRKRGLGKGEKHVSMEQEESSPYFSIPPLTDEVGDDSFVEIYAKLLENNVELVYDQSNNAHLANDDDDDDDGSPGISIGLTSNNEDERAAETRIFDSPVDECYSELSSEENPEQQSEIPGSGMELPAIEYVDCDNQVESEEVDLLKDYNDGHSDCCTVNVSTETRDLAETEVQDLLPEASIMDGDGEMLRYLHDGLADNDSREIVVEKLVQETYEDNNTHKDVDYFSSDFSECEDALSDGTDMGFEITREIVLKELVQEAVKDHTDEDEHIGSDISVSEVTHSDGTDHDLEDVSVGAALDDDQRDGIPEPNSPEIDSSEVHKEEANGNLNNSDSYGLVFRGSEEDIFEETTDATEPESVDCIQEAADRGLADEKSEIEELEAVQDMEKNKEEVECQPLHDGIETKNENSELEGTTCMPEILVPDHGLIERNTDIAQGDDTKAEPETKAGACDEVTSGLCDEGDPSEDQPDTGSFEGNKDKSENFDQFQEDSSTSATKSSKSTSKCDDGMNCKTQKDDIDPDEEEECLLAGFEWAEECIADADVTSISSQILSETSDSELKARYSYTRKRVDKDLEELKPFNPRAPNFLPVEPDTEAETVDLKHQMMDERKNAEEWMIDYALQRAVSKLAPARKRKVALLVEAFETVEAPPQHCRTIQACS